MNNANFVLIVVLLLCYREILLLVVNLPVVKLVKTLHLVPAIATLVYTV